MVEFKVTPSDALKKQVVDKYSRPSYLETAFPQFANEIYKPWIVDLQNQFPPEVVWKKEHSDRNAFVAGKLTEYCLQHHPEYQLEENDPLASVQAALVHDVGFSRNGPDEVPIKIINKESALRPEERQVMMRHVRLGFDMIKPHDPWIAQIMAGHHEFTKNPYPRDYRKELPEAIIEQRAPFEERLYRLRMIQSVIDAFDAMVSERPYQFNPMSIDEARRRLKEDRVTWINQKGEVDTYPDDIIDFVAEQRAKLSGHYPSDKKVA
jgi:HD-GYP domain-containing protein (c-di-GMP phosphodiesterase class II)